MRQKLYRTFYFYLVTAGLPVLLLYLLLGNARLSAALYAFMIALAFPISLLPGHVGKSYIPLRFPIAVFLALLAVAMQTHLSVQMGIFFLRGALSGLITGIMMLFAVRETSLSTPTWTGHNGALIGLVLYAVPGVALSLLMKEPFLKNMMWIQALIFLSVTAYSLNSESMLTGLATRSNVRPPKSLTRGNRALTIAFAVIVAVITLWGQLREAARQFALWCARTCLVVIYRILSLFNNDGSTSTGDSGGGMGEMFGAMPDAEKPYLFWIIMERVMIVIAIVIAIILIVLALRVIYKKLKKLVYLLREYLARFAQSSSEDYEDEQIDLFDLDDLREKAKDRLQKVIRRFTQRTPKWEEMNMRERVRYCVRILYENSGYNAGELCSLTIREAVPKLPKTTFSEEQLTALYEKARYSSEEPSEQEAEDLRKAVKS